MIGNAVSVIAVGICLTSAMFVTINFYRVWRSLDTLEQEMGSALQKLDRGLADLANQLDHAKADLSTKLRR